MLSMLNGKDIMMMASLAMTAYGLVSIAGLLSAA